MKISLVTMNNGFEMNERDDPFPGKKPGIGCSGVNGIRR